MVSATRKVYFSSLFFSCNAECMLKYNMNESKLECHFRIRALHILWLTLSTKIPIDTICFRKIFSKDGCRNRFQMGISLKKAYFIYTKYDIFRHFSLFCRPKVTTLSLQLFYATLYRIFLIYRFGPKLYTSVFFLIKYNYEPWLYSTSSSSFVVSSIFSPLDIWKRNLQPTVLQTLLSTQNVNLKNMVESGTNAFAAAPHFVSRVTILRHCARDYLGHWRGAPCPCLMIQGVLLLFTFAFHPASNGFAYFFCYFGMRGRYFFRSFVVIFQASRFFVLLDLFLPRAISDRLFLS